MSEHISIVIPAYNEQERIADVVRSLVEVGYRHVVVVDDGSADDTAGAARRAGADVIVHAVNRGQGAALQTGTEYARHAGASIVVHFDGDGQFNPCDVGPAVDRLRAGGYDIVLGSRFLDNRSSSMPWVKRRLIFPVARFLNLLFTGVKLTDVHNGFRVLGGRAMHAIEITHDRFSHNSDIVAQIRKQNLRYCEISVEVRYYEYGQGLVGGLQILRDWLVGWFID